MSAPAWVATASRHALITRDELLAWLQIDGAQLRVLYQSDETFPAPRIRGFARLDKLTRRCRWRVGDVRAWLAGRSQAAEDAARLAHEEAARDGGSFRRAWRGMDGGTL